MKRPRLYHAQGFLVMLMALLGTLVLFHGLSAAATPAGTVIQNTASLDILSQGFPFSASSDTTSVTVNAFYQVNINPPRTDYLQAGGSMALVHTVSNGANMPDTIDVEAVSSLGMSVELYAADGITPLTDSDGNGKADTGTIPVAGSVDIVLKLTAPGSLADGQVDNTMVTATSVTAPAATSSVTNTVTILAPKFWDPLEKTVNPSGRMTPDSIVTYTNTFGNAGGVPATNVVITDPLDVNLIYQEGSATAPPGISGTVITYDALTRTITWTIPSIPSGYRGEVHFKARINPDTLSDTVIENMIDMSSDQNPVAQASNSVKITVVEQPLRITKSSNQELAEIGDYVVYNVEVKNVSKQMTAHNVTIVDSLPQGFRYLKESSTLDSEEFPDPEISIEPQWNIGALLPGQSRTLSYRTLVSIDAPLGNGVNTATVSGKSPGGNPLEAGPSSVTVKAKEGALSTKTVIMGRVFVDENGDKMPDHNEQGIRDVRLYLEDGTYAVTDDEGKFSIYGVEPGDHVLKIDPMTIPAGHESVPLDSSFAGDGGSRFINVPFGGPARGDFGLEPLDRENAAAIRGVTAIPDKDRKKKKLTFGTEMNTAPIPLEEQILTMPDTPGIISPMDGEALTRTWSDILIRVPEGAAYTLTVNGDKTSPLRIGKTIHESQRKLFIHQYIGTSLHAGPNQIVLKTETSDGKIVINQIEITVPGVPEKIVIDPDRADVPSDSKTVVPFTVKLFDAWDSPSPVDSVITVISEKGEILDDDLEPSVTGHQIMTHQGVAEFRLRSTSRTGRDTISVLLGNGLKGSADVYFTPEIRDWIIVGTGSLTAGSRSVSGNVEKITESDDFEQGIYQDGRLAFFAKGKVLGKYLLTAAYDSEKEENEDELFRQVDPEKYYPVYGDASNIGYDVESHDKLYVKIESGRSSVMYGDYHTDLSKNEFTRYDRTFNGVKADIETDHYALKSFGTLTSQTITRDELEANGTSGYYFLDKSPVIENSEKVRIEVRDRYHSDIVISVTEKTRYSDYTINYDTGAILFHQPVPSADENLNPVTIVITYESDDSGDEYYIYGGRAAYRTDGGSEIGLTGIVEENDLKDTSLYGIDATLKITDRTILRTEAAQSNAYQKEEDTAWKAELSSAMTDRLNLAAYYRNIGEEFYNPSMSGSETGTEKYGARIQYRAFEKTLVFGESSFEEYKVDQRKLQTSSLGIQHAFSRFTAEAGLADVREENEADGGEAKTSQIVFAGAGGNITDRLNVSLRRDQVISSEEITDYETKTALHLNYKITDNITSRLTQELQEYDEGLRSITMFGLDSRLTKNMSLKTGYQNESGFLGNIQKGNVELNTQWGSDSAFSLLTRTGYQLENALSEERGQAILGLNTHWQVIDGLTLNTTFERIEPVQGEDNSENTAFTIAAEYLRSEHFKTTGRYELGISDTETTHLFSIGGAFKFSNSITLLGKTTLWESIKDSGGSDRKFDGMAGVAYRPSGKPSVYALSTLRFTLDSVGSSETDNDMKKLVSSTEFSYIMYPGLTLLGKYAGKYAWEDIGNTQFDSYTDLVLAGLLYDITKRWYAGIDAKLMNQYEVKMHSVSAIVRAGYRVAKNFTVEAGYNSSELNDRDLSGEGYQSHGPFIKLNMKFDEGTLRDLASLSSGPDQKPAPPAMNVAVRTEEEPVELVGSVEAMTLLVNDSEVGLPSGDVLLSGNAVNDLVEVKGGELERPVEFSIALKDHGTVNTWELLIMDINGRTLRSISGPGAPPATVYWNGILDEEARLRGGEIYQYRLDTEYADGSRLSSPVRLFGVNGTSAVAIILSSNAFMPGSSTLSSTAKQTLREAASIIRKYPQEKIIIEGHASSAGSDKLARTRSEAAASYLVKEENIPQERILVRFSGTPSSLLISDIQRMLQYESRVEIKGESLYTEKPDMISQYHTPPFVRINGTPVMINELGRFSHRIAEKEDQLEVAMGDDNGRSLQTTVLLPTVVILESAADVRLSHVPGKTNQDGRNRAMEASYPLKGKTEKGNTVEINGTAVNVGEDGTFTSNLHLNNGENIYWLKIRNAEGYTRYARLIVKVSETAVPNIGDKKNRETIIDKVLSTLTGFIGGTIKEMEK